MSETFDAARCPSGPVPDVKARTGALLCVLPGHEEPITSIAFAPDGRTLATSDWGGRVRIWSVK